MHDGDAGHGEGGGGVEGVLPGHRGVPHPGADPEQLLCTHL